MTWSGGKAEADSSPSCPSASADSSVRGSQAKAHFLCQLLVTLQVHPELSGITGCVCQRCGAAQGCCAWWAAGSAAGGWTGADLLLPESLVTRLANPLVRVDRQDWRRLSALPWHPNPRNVETDEQQPEPGLHASLICVRVLIFLQRTLPEPQFPITTLPPSLQEGSLEDLSPELFPAGASQPSPKSPPQGPHAAATSWKPVARPGPWAPMRGQLWGSRRWVPDPCPRPPSAVGMVLTRDTLARCRFAASGA